MVSNQIVHLLIKKKKQNKFIAYKHMNSSLCCFLQPIKKNLAIKKWWNKMYKKRWVAKIKLIGGKWKKGLKKQNGEWHKKTSYTFETYWNM
jgi:hypothetical protein